MLEGRVVLNASSLVPSFGNGGVVLTPLNDGMGTSYSSDQVAAVATQSDGKVVEAELRVAATNGGSVGSVVVRRYTAGGVLDTTFGTNGQTAIPTPGATVLDSGNIKLKLGTDGTIVLGAVTFPTNAPSTGQSLVARLTPAGRLDPTFGTNGEALLPGAIGDLTDLAVQGDGKVVMVSAGPATAATTLSNYQFTVARLTTAGALDTGFNGSGSLQYTLTSGSNTVGYLYGQGIAIAPGGQVYVATSVVVNGSSAGVTDPGTGLTDLIRVNTDGTLDATYASAGIKALALSGVTRLAVQGDGKVVLAGFSYPVFAGGRVGALTRLNSDGSADATFQTTTGAATTGIASRFGTFRALALGDDGTITVAGGADPSEPGGVLVAHFLANGAADRTYGVNGLVTVNPATVTPPFPPAAVPSPNLLPSLNSMALATGGNVIVGGINGNRGGFLAEVRPATLRTVANDYDGDGRSDMAVELANSATFAYRPSGGGADVLQSFGVAGVGATIPAPGNYDGSGVTNVAGVVAATRNYVYRPATPGHDVGGLSGTLPAPGDYLGDGRTQKAVYDPRSGSFLIDTTTATGAALNTVTIQFGMAGANNSIPAPGDYDGDGRTDLAVYMPTLGALAYRPSGGGPDMIVPFGQAGLNNSVPTPGDYDGDGRTDLSVYLPKLGLYAYRPSDGGRDVLAAFGTAGVGASVPTPGDYDGDGRTDLSVYIPGQGVYAYRPSGGGADVVRLFGTPGVGLTVPAASIPYAQGATAIATSSAAGASTIRAAAVFIPLTDGLTDPTAKKKATGTA